MDSSIGKLIIIMARGVSEANMMQLLLGGLACAGSILGAKRMAEAAALLGTTHAAATAAAQQHLATPPPCSLEVKLRLHARLAPILLLLL
jgi:hypothetical protein